MKKSLTIEGFRDSLNKREALIAACSDSPDELGLCITVENLADYSLSDEELMLICGVYYQHNNTESKLFP